MIIIDVRTKEEFDEGHVEGAINIPADSFMRANLPSELKRTKKEDHIVLYCHSGNRASAVQNALYKHGYTHIENCINQPQTEARIRRK